MNVAIYLSAVKLLLFELLMEPKEILYQVNPTSVISSLQKNHADPSDVECS